MKTNLFRCLVSLACCISLALADEVLVNTNTGEVRIEESNPWRQLTAIEAEAYAYPLKKFPVWSGFDWEKRGFWYLVQVKSSTNSIFYGEGRIQSLSTKEAMETKKIFLLYKPLLLLAISLMIMSNVTHGRNDIAKFHTITSSLFATASTLISIVTSMVPSTVFVFFILATAVAGFSATFTSFDFHKRRRYWISSTLFYTSALVALCV